MIDRPYPNAGIRPHRTPARPEFLYRFEATLDPSPIGIVPEGLRFVVPFDGTVTRGAFAGHRVWGTDHFLLRRDGVGVIDASKTISGPDRHIAEQVRGYVLPPEGMELPPLEAMLEPGFQWPDRAFAVIGSSTFRASGELGEHLNRVVATVEGWCNFATGALAVETRLLGINGGVPGPRTSLAIA